MKILVGKTFGIGNAVLSVPMLKAIASGGHEIDVLTGSGRDDFGAVEVMIQLQQTYNFECIQNVWLDAVSPKHQYDLAIMAIPYDGRWRNGHHFYAKEVWDERKRPDNVQRLGFDMWKKHEVEYQMENARKLGLIDIETPSLQFLTEPTEIDDDLVYLGIGYKRDTAGFGLSKHFGNERYAALMQTIRKIRPQTKFVSTGGPADMLQTFYQMVKHIDADYSEFYRFHALSLQHSFDIVKRCKAYIGNDTGMMHIAASIGMPTCGLFSYPDLMVKNPPFCDRSKSILFDESSSVESIAEQFVDFVWGV